MSKKVLPVVLIVLFGGIFWAFRSRGNSGGDDILSKQQQILSTIGVILEQRHYNPRKIDDAFSKDVFNKYLNDLDPNKDLFLKSDVEALKKYETTIDDEIHGAPIQFFPAAAKISQQRLQEATELYKTMLAQPFSFQADEEVQLDGDKLDYPANAEERKERWRKKLKYLALERFVDLQNERERAVDTAAIKKDSDAALEKQAREKVGIVVSRMLERIQKTFNEEEQFNLFVNDITNIMDPHTNYLPPVEKRNFYEDMSGRFYGIGAQLKEEDGVVKIASLIVGMPAWKNGEIQVNDVITKVGQGSNEAVDVTGYGVLDVVKLIRGDKGTEVRLTLKKQDGILQTVSLIRDEIVQDEYFARSAVIQQGDKKIGYIFLPEFYADFERADGARCSDDVAKELIKLKNENVQGIIMDLRGNPGGSLPEVTQMVGLFIKTGPVVQVRDRDGKPALWKDDDDSVLYSGPLTVMVNEGSASASEIFAAAIQDYKRGIVLGSTSTYGKGTVQKPIPIGSPADILTNPNKSGALVLTFEKFYRVNGGSTQLKGVTPDIILPDAYEYLKIREKDNPYALKWDQIPKTNYTPWASNIDFKQVKANSEKRVAADTAFNIIKRNTDWLSKNSERAYNLNINKYKQQQEKIKEVMKKDDNLVKLSKKMDINPVSVDRDKFFNNPDKPKGERYKKWLENLQSDLYINETVNVVNDMINSDQNYAKQ